VRHIARIALVAVTAFLIPMGIVIGSRWDNVKRYISISPEDVEGYVLYFNSYG
jgi:hypothetical protein